MAVWQGEWGKKGCERKCTGTDVVGLFDGGARCPSCARMDKAEPYPTDFLRASTQAGKTSGFSSQTSIHCTISSFLVRFSGVVRGVMARNFARSLAAITWRRQ